MRGSFKLARVFGIDIDIHFTFFLLLALFALLMGPRGLVLIVGVFFFVTLHELCHSLAAAYFGIQVKRITLLPIGGVASMAEMPKKPHQELVISLAGPVFNILVVAVFYFPLTALLGRETLMYPFLVLTGRAEYTGGFNILAHIYWINLILAVFNILPAFPMDGGRALRALMATRIGYKKATRAAVRLGHIFALFFGYLGLVNGHIFLIIIAVFIYMAASSEGMQVQVRETIKKYRVRDILGGVFETVSPTSTLAEVLEKVFHKHQEDFPVMEDGRLAGFITRRDLIRAAHEKDKSSGIGGIMRTDIPPVSASTPLDRLQKIMQDHNTSALPVEENGRITGVVTLDDVNRLYIMLTEE
ncbi:MAG: CBS domain-containing protein [Candidatus Omnitrophica bacterium]|nr:CBS domain-containing protein [Candidatus Omnitrophota bacterium]